MNHLCPSPPGVPIINVRKTWEKLLVAARIIAAVENPADVCVLSNRPYGQVCGLVPGPYGM